MKRVLFFLMTMIAVTSFGQAPDAINYQAICKTDGGAILTDATIGVQVNIIETSEVGPIVYSEEHSVSTNSNGIFAIEIGRGTTSDNFNGIAWGSDSHYLEILIDTLGGTTYESVGITEVLSAPYSYYSNRSDTAMYAANTTVGISDLASGFTVDTLSGQIIFNVTDPVAETMLNADVTFKIYDSGGALVLHTTKQRNIYSMQWELSLMPLAVGNYDAVITIETFNGLRKIDFNFDVV